FAALSGVLILPNIGLEPYTLTLLATYAFAAAAIGAFTNILLAFAGGILVGVAQSLVGYYVNSRGLTTLSGLPDALPFVILFVALLALPRRRLWGGSEGTARPSADWSAPPSVRLGAGVAVVAALCLVPVVVGTKLPLFSFGLCQAILVLSLGLLVRTSGQVSLCHAAFAGIGAAAFSQFSVGLHLPWLVAFFLAALVVVPVGAFVALPAIRLNGIYLALATFGFGILVTRLVFPQTWMFFSYVGSRAIPSPFGISSDRGRYYIVLIVLGLAALTVTIVVKSRLGRLLRGMGGTETGVTTLGLSTNVTKVLVFCISAFLAASAGIMYGMVYTSVDGGTTVFQPFNSFVLLAVLTVAPFGAPWYAIFAGGTSVISGYFSGSRPTMILNAIFGFFAIVVSLQGGPPSAPKWVRSLTERVVRRPIRPMETPEPTGIRPRPVSRIPEVAAGLEVDRLSVHFGGLVAVDDVAFSAPLGQITGLIGPNGAGKTTIFNACSGINRDIQGTFHFLGRDISRLGAPARARIGLGRSFQRMELGDSLSVLENVSLGYECAHAGSHVIGQLMASRTERNAMRAAAADALDLCGISQLAGRKAGALSTGHRRLVELARCLAGPFSLLLLDEPSSGLDRSETSEFGAVLQRVVEERGCGVLLVEHDMSLVMRVCADIYVLDFGKVIASGTPDEIGASSIVRAAYLGSDFELEDRSEVGVAQSRGAR
ncbi:MAG TPA: ATP-binding cassette domain-containing protein, partial [Acidimicrobiales bacterium]|nr:ATP-binding cassette domain-containing protein [Acidimicrobiales bacterium]